MSFLILANLDPLVAIVLVSLAGALGLLVGSFLNVVIWRVPRKLSIVSPPSSCPRCGTRISPQHNIPVISWVLLRGKCAQCKEPISVRYPLVELSTAVAFAALAYWGVLGGAHAVFSRHGAGVSDLALVIATALFWWLAASTIALALIDLDVHRLPNSIVYSGYGAALIGFLVLTLVTSDWASALRAVVGMVALFVAYLLMAIAYPPGMGLGDVKLAGLLGLYLGWMGPGELIIGSFAAFVLGGVFSIALLAMGKAGRKSGIPFGPWMLGGAWVGIIWGDGLFASYLNLVGLG